MSVSGNVSAVVSWVVYGAVYGIVPKSVFLGLSSTILYRAK